MKEYLKKEPTRAHLFSVALNDNPGKYVFAKTHYGEDALGYYCPTDKGLQALIKDAQTQALDVELPLIVLLAKGGARMTPAERELQQLLSGFVREVRDDSTYPTFARHVSADGTRRWGVYDNHDSPGMPVHPPLIADGKHVGLVNTFSFGSVWRDIGDWSTDPDDAFAQECAEAYTEQDMSRFACLWRILSFGAWASRADEVRNLLPTTYLATHH